MFVIKLWNSSVCVVSCVKYVDSGSSCLSLCFLTPAVQISITNISPWVTLSFLSVKRPWLACIHVQIGPKSSGRDRLWMRVLIKQKGKGWVLMHLYGCTTIQACTPRSNFSATSLFLFQIPRSLLFLLVHSSLQKETSPIDESKDKLRFVSAQFSSLY